MTGARPPPLHDATLILLTNKYSIQRLPRTRADPALYLYSECLPSITAWYGVCSYKEYCNYGQMGARLDLPTCTCTVRTRYLLRDSLPAPECLDSDLTSPASELSANSICYDCDCGS